MFSKLNRITKFFLRSLEILYLIFGFNFNFDLLLDFTIKPGFNRNLLKVFMCLLNRFFNNQQNSSNRWEIALGLEISVFHVSMLHCIHTLITHQNYVKKKMFCLNKSDKHRHRAPKKKSSVICLQRNLEHRKNEITLKNKM